MARTIRDPVSYTVQTLGGIFGLFPRMLGRIGGHRAVPEIRPIQVEDIRTALRAGMADLVAFRSDAIFAVLIYPAAGLGLVWFAFNNAMLPLLFPLVAGFTIVGPVLAIGLYEMSRRRAAGQEASWLDGLKLLSSPSIGAILLMGAVLLGLFAVWLAAAALVYAVTLGPEPPAGVADLITRTLTTGAGWMMILLGCAVGAVFAAIALTISFISIPLLVDRDVGLAPAIATSIKAARASPGPVALWGAIVAIGLAVASIPLLLGLILVFPLLGHATWHLYRRTVVWKDRKDERPIAVRDLESSEHSIAAPDSRVVPEEDRPGFVPR